MWIPMLHGLPWLESDRLAAAVVLFDCLRTCLGTVQSGASALY